MKKSIPGISFSDWRKTTQELLPSEKPPPLEGEQYNLYPAHELDTGRLYEGFKSLAVKIKGYNTIIIDGYIGVFWDYFRKKLDHELALAGQNVNWLDISKAMKSPKEIDDIKAPFLGGDDPIFGSRFTGGLKDFFSAAKLNKLKENHQQDGDMTIVYGCGASLIGWDVPLIYVDLPKNELQFRSRAQKVCNLGSKAPAAPKKMYKQFYFVDWIALNKHKQQVLPRVDWIVDEQHPDKPVFMQGEHFREALHDLSRSYFRARPWFEPGAWGGQWCKQHIPSLPKGPVNYAWSFELISPENGLIFSSNNLLMEASFDWLMYQEHQAVLGDSSDEFGYTFPIRFDFLDTFDGGNLSVQCHPKPSFIREQFGEIFTQDETYYMLDCKPGAQVYLGFQDDINAETFRTKLEQSAENNTPVTIEDYVQTFTAKKHDLFLIPHGIIHCSGTNNMVLEISATPYIFTFKMYDWLRLDLDGTPRPLNIERAFKNLNFEYKGERVQEELISKPSVLEEGEDWSIVHLPTHKKHFYDIHRFEFINEIEIKTNGSCHTMSLVEGSSIILETENGRQGRFNFAETFVIPAAANSYRLINEGDEPAKVIKAFIKPDVKIERLYF